MTVNGISGANNGMQAGSSGRITQMDSVSKNIQNHIANAQKKLQELSSNEELSMEDKMKKRQEIQQEINNLNQQLRQHQMEQRKEQQTKKTSMDDMLGGSRKTGPKSGKQSAGLSQASMQAMISADSSMKQAKVQGSMATQMEGKAGVLESEIKMDKGRGASTEKKEEELADLQEKAQAAKRHRYPHLQMQIRRWKKLQRQIRRFQRLRIKISLKRRMQMTRLMKIKNQKQPEKIRILQLIRMIQFQRKRWMQYQMV